ncbi:MAG TPA: phosphatase PAP2 family protein [Thermoanaerobaculia bacterium]|jgi:membrane-associated phospholipid phosphatase
MDFVREGLPPGRNRRSDRRLHPYGIAVAVALLFALQLNAAEVGGATPATPKERLKEVVSDAKDIFPAPVKRWRGHEWIRFGEGLALVAAMYPLDQSIVNAFQRNHGQVTTRYFHAVTHLGGGYGQDLVLLTIAGGYFGHDQRLLDTGFDALESSVFAAGIVTPAIKTTVGRARPIADLGRHSVHPFDKDLYQSFPSGHATSAFAIATAIANRYDDHPSVPAIAYTLATTIAFARVYDRAHFPSDVVAGALIGHAVAKSIVHNHVTVVPEHRALLVDVKF